MDQPECPIWQFGQFCYDPNQRLLFRDGSLVQVVPKAIDVLHALLERRGRVVEKSELMKLVWPDTTVDEVGLARNVSILRKALGDDSDPPTYIETIPRRGYRFVAPVTEVDRQPSAAPRDAPSPRRSRRRLAWFGMVVCGLALLATLIYWQFYRPSRYLSHGDRASTAAIPFQCSGAGARCAEFSRSLDDDLSTELSKLDRVAVVSPETVNRYRSLGISPALMARMLGLEVLVEGSIRETGDGLRVTARLVDVHTGRLIWSEGYDAQSLGGPQGAAKRISAEVGLRLSGSGNR